MSPLSSVSRVPLVVWGVALCAGAHGYQINDSLSVGGLAAGVWQCQQVAGNDEREGAEDTCAAAGPLQPELDWHPIENGLLHIKLGFALGNGLKGETVLSLAPWAADVEDDVENMNGRKFSHILNAWYRHEFPVGGRSALQWTLGIVDATDYLDGNRFANDEFTQFMNEALVNGPNVFLPSYDAGTALVWQRGRWVVSGVYMNVGENDGGHSYDFVGAEVHYRVHTGLGEGNYRFLIDYTDDSFTEEHGDGLSARHGAIASIDQDFNDVVGGWLRFGWQSQDATVSFSALYSGGLNFHGTAWGREHDNIGLGYARLPGANAEYDYAQVAEIYYRLALGRYMALTADLQYQQNALRYRSSLTAWVAGLRLVVEISRLLRSILIG